MRYATGRYMGHQCFRGAYEVEDVVGMVRRVYENRVRFHDGDAEIAPGISVHLIGGHTMGLQAVRVKTRSGWLVLASDASHFYANMDETRPFPIVWSVADMVEGYRKLTSLAESPAHIVPGHDPLVFKRYPAASRDLEESRSGWTDPRHRVLPPPELGHSSQPRPGPGGVSKNPRTGRGT